MRLTWQLHHGNALDVIPTLPEASVDCVVTSPPYWGLRTYAAAPEQFGREATPDEYVARIVAVGAELWRVLTPAGTWLLNLGDSYANDDKWGGSSSGKHCAALHGNTGVGRGRRNTSLKPKDLVGIPWRVAFALQSAGWWLRAEILWHKPNPMPESVRDRVTRAHEHVFHLTRSARYYWNADAIREPLAPSTMEQIARGYYGQGTKDYATAGVQNPSDVKRRILAKRRSVRSSVDVKGGGQGAGVMTWDAAQGSNARSVWTIPTEPSPYEHFAVMPRALARKCIVAACPPEGVVLDPFAGMSTTGAVALEEGRNFIGIELSSKYYGLSRDRLAGVAPLLSVEVPA